MLVFICMFMLVGFSYAAPCPSTDGLIASTNATCECETATSGETICEGGEYCAVQGNNAQCLDNPLCSPNSFNVGDPCYCSNDIMKLGSKCMNYCYNDYTCSNYPKCKVSTDPLATDCCYSSCDSAAADICKAASTYTENGCVEPEEICSADSSSEQSCEVVSRCVNENKTSCYDEFDVLNGCGEMPDEFQGNNACGVNAVCSRGYCIGCPGAISYFDGDKCRCDCDAYYSGWIGERQCSEDKETYKEAYNFCECNLS